MPHLSWVVSPKRPQQASGVGHAQRGFDSAAESGAVSTSGTDQEETRDAWDFETGGCRGTDGPGGAGRDGETDAAWRGRCLQLRGGGRPRWVRPAELGRQAERAANPNTLYLFNGDMLSPSLASGFDQGQNTIDFTNLVPFDLAVPGNHEFDFGPENFFQKMKASKYPWAAINITNGDGSAIEGLGGVMVKEVGSLKVALIPLAQDTSPEVSSTGSLKFPCRRWKPASLRPRKRARRARISSSASSRPGTGERPGIEVASHAFDVILSGDDPSLCHRL